MNTRYSLVKGERIVRYVFTTWLSAASGISLVIYIGGRRFEGSFH